MTRKRVFDIALDDWVWVGEPEPEDDSEPDAEPRDEPAPEIVADDWRERRYPPSIGRYIPNKRDDG